MFTGIIENLGTLQERHDHGSDQTLVIAAPTLDFSTVRLGDSIAVNGVCLTVRQLGPQNFSADVSKESLERTTLGELAPGQPVNLELALTLSKPLGGHLVSGHVDGVGQLLSRRDEGRSERLEFRMPKEIAHYVAVKGSIAIDGISLTVNGVADDRFQVNIIPHTSEHSTLGSYKEGQRVNLEVDLIARYVERLLRRDSDHKPLSLEDLMKAGF